MGNNKQAYRVQFGDVAYYDFLLDAGLTPNKSLTIGKLRIPVEFYGSFLRGVFDGDGTCYGYNDPRWPTSFLYYTGFSSASKVFLEYLASTNASLYQTKGTSIRKAPRALSLVYCKADSLILYAAMYKNAGSLFLGRKRSKLEAFITRDMDGIIAREARVVKLVNTLL